MAEKKLEKRVAMLEKIAIELKEENKMLATIIKDVQTRELQVLSVKQVAQKAGVSEKTIRNQTKLGLLRIRYPHINKYHPHDVDCWMRGRKAEKRKVCL